MTRNRKHIAPSTRDEVLRESGYMCGNPTCRHVLTLELHHMVWIKDDGGNDPTNLIALCPNCHSLHTAGHIPSSAIRHWKGILHALNHAFSRESMDLLLFLNSKDAQKMWLSGDGVLKFSGLIAAGLVKFEQQAWMNTISIPGPAPSSSHKLKLTEKGEALIAAWLAGDEDSYRKVLEEGGSTDAGE